MENKIIADHDQFLEKYLNKKKVKTNTCSLRRNKVKYAKDSECPRNQIQYFAILDWRRRSENYIHIIYIHTYYINHVYILKKGLRSIITLIKTGRKERKCCRAGQSKKKKRVRNSLWAKNKKNFSKRESRRNMCEWSPRGLYL